MNELKQEILEKINHPSLHMGIYIENLKTKEQLCYQEDDVFETASTIKVFILAYLYHEFSCNHLKREDTVKYELEHVTTGTSILSLLEPGFSISLKNCAILMITYSDNIATNLLIDALGGVDKINQFIRELGFSKTKLLNKICVEKGLPVGVTTAQEYASFFKQVYHGTMIDKESSEEMLAILKKQQLITRTTKFLNAKDVKERGTDNSEIYYIATKSGHLPYGLIGKKNVCHDGGIISTVFGDYILIMLADGFEESYIGENHEITNLEAHISELVYKHFSRIEK